MFTGVGACDVKAVAVIFVGAGINIHVKSGFVTF